MPTDICVVFSRNNATLIRLSCAIDNMWDNADSFHVNDPELLKQKSCYDAMGFFKEESTYTH